MDSDRNRKLSIREVARLAGTSVGTVSNVFNHPERVSGALRRRVERVVEASGFSPNATARALSLGRSSLVGTVFFDISNPFFAETAHGLGRCFEASGCSIVVAETGQIAEVEKRALLSLERVGVDAVIVCSTGGCWEELARLRDCGVPVLLMAQRSERPGFPAVGVNDYEGMRKIAAHLCSRGMTRFCFVNEGIRATQHKDRWSGFADELASRSLDLESVDVQWASGPTWDGGYEVARRVLAGGRGHWPDAFVCLNDYLALGVSKAVTELGLRVGADVGVSGFDDVPYASVVEAPLTTVRQPIAEMCEFIAGEVVASFENGAPVSGRTFEAELVGRQSA